jgi:PAS domain S-box-containing protein
MKKTAFPPVQPQEAPAPPSAAREKGHAPCPSHILARYRALLTVLDDAVIMVDAGTGIIVDANLGACRLLGQSADRIIGRHQTDLHPPQESDRHAAMFKDVVEATIHHDGVTVRAVNLCRTDGTIIPCEVSNILVEEDRRLVIIGVFRDMTPKKEAEQALRASERRFRLLVENSPDAFFLHDMDGTIIDVNQRACDMLDFDARELLGTQISRVEALCPPATLEAIWNNVRPGGFSLDGLARRKDGSTFPAEIQGVVFTERKRPLCLVSVRDMTARKELEQSLMRALERAMAESHEKCVFLASISHEIRTPLNIILGMTEVLRETPTAECRPSFLEAIENAGQVLLRLVNDILDLSRIEADTLDLRPTPIDLPALLTQTGETMRVAIEHKGLAFRTALAHDLPPRILADPDRLRQILMNLLWNALKFTSQGSIVLQAERVAPPDRPAYLRLAVEDTGIGIPASQLERIFLPFTQAAGATGHSRDGAGLGLAISKRLVERMGGRIWVESQPGRGSRFLFSLPIAPGPDSREAPGIESPTTVQPTTATQAARVLLVEDNSSNQELLKLFLENEPYHVVIASSGDEALELFAHQVFDCILMDVELPGMDGCETAAAIRQRERETGARPVPIVILTAHAFSEYEHKARQAGCDGFLSKPIRKSGLLAELRRVLDVTA